ncbi:helix-turn-helix domain-containing protein [Microtetraspora sp. AC03309]|uniref:PucR family transcriptional regulator n=1 Tax=Microtetraspora sp. AC03309 TaxID=2779376 RepID=UPI001E611585|nr:helix-turn-helix domain-containing protein [Microtetraspora sp. AC03309]MCC5579921.1 helix-turn-helix domain-containing protein [Microtetraspora sp. AC03309]
MADLQRIVDELALRLGRPLLLEDGHQRVIAYSVQDGPMDDVRRDSILRRHTTPEVRAFLRAAGIHEATGPLRTPGAAELGLLPRICVPVRHDGRPLGFLWFVDVGPVMTEAEIAVATAAVPALALALFHESLASGLASRRELEAVTGLLRGEAEAARTLVEAGAFPPAAPVTVAVARPLSAEADEALRLTLERGLLAVRRRLSGHHPLHLVRYDHGVLLTAGTTAFPEEMRAALGAPILIGIGGPRPSLSRASESYEEALHAAEVAAKVPELGRSAEWTRLGVYRMLTGIPGGNLHPGLEKLLDDAQHRPLLETLEIYLDLAGNAQATSRRLRLHRTSLYYRLQRVEELAETDLRDGVERLSLHLSLKLARLSGRYHPSSVLSPEGTG